MLWQKSIGTVASNGNCGTYGVSSTGVVDTASGVLYVVGASGALHALRLTDGSEAPGWPVRVVSRRGPSTSGEASSSSEHALRSGRLVL